jgi:hypothetical protein
MPKFPSRRNQLRDAAEAGRTARREKPAEGLPIEPFQQKPDSEASGDEAEASMHVASDHDDFGGEEEGLSYIWMCYRF